MKSQKGFTLWNARHKRAGKADSTGFSVVEGLLLVVIVVILGGIGWYVYDSQKKSNESLNTAAETELANPSKKKTEQPATGNQSQQTIIKTDEELIKEALLQYCKGDYKKEWEDANNVKIDASTVTAKTQKLTIKNSFARDDNSSCDTTQLSDSQKFSGFIAYFKKTNNSWQFFTKDQQAPECSKFDGQGWPAEVVPSCYDTNGSTRAPR